MMPTIQDMTLPNDAKKGSPHKVRAGECGIPFLYVYHEQGPYRPGTGRVTMPSRG